MEKKERMLRSGEVAKILGVDRHTVVKWIKEGKIRAIKLPSGRYRIPESEVKKILEGRSD
nr:helix-turn-helix domain-containing protein [Candidatus Baldrarchaeota archaeon]